MNLFALVFLFIVTLSLQFNKLLPNSVVLVIFAGLLFLRFLKVSGWRTASSAALIALLLVQAGLRYELWHLPDPQRYGKTLIVRGTVEGIAQQRTRSVRFQLLLDEGTRKEMPIRAKRLRLDWYGAQRQLDEELRAGQVWELSIKLRRPGGAANPGGFDYARWLFQRRIHAIGYVQKSQANRLVMRQPAYQTQTRLWLAQRLAQQAEGSSHSGLMQALLVGLREGITQSSNDLLRATGTSHLLAISGLHIGMLAFWGYTLGTLLWRLLGRVRGRRREPRVANAGHAPGPGERRSNQVEFSTLLSLVAAVVYAWLAGFTLPTQRALIMLMVVFALRLSRRHSAALTPLSLALLLIVFNDPLAPLTAGFWLSFVSVLILLGITATGKGVDSRWQQMARSHWLMGVLLFPLTAFFFGQASLVAPLANAFAIPFVSFLVVPLLFVWLMLTGIVPAAGELLLQVIEFNLSVLIRLLELLREWLPAEISLQQLHPLHFGSFVCALLLLLLPQLRQWRILTLPLAVPFLWSQWSPLGVPGVKISALSAGNRPLVVVQSGREVLVAGFGGFYRGGGNRVKSVLLPFMHAEGIKQIDHLVLPAAGMAAAERQYPQLQEKQARALAQLREQVPVLRVTGNSPGDCGKDWLVGLTQFRLASLSGTRISGDPQNTGPCALVMQGTGLNTGFSLAVFFVSPPANIHPGAPAPSESGSAGTDTSAIVVMPDVNAQKPADLEPLRRIVDWLRPGGVVFAASSGKETGFPPERRQMRYTLRGANAYRTDRDGAVEFSILNGGKVEVLRFREQNRRPWH